MKTTSVLTLPTVAILSAFGCATTGGPRQTGAVSGDRVWIDPLVVLASFGEPNFEHDAAVVKAYEAQLHAARGEAAGSTDCGEKAPPRQPTARERLEGRRPAAVKQECPPPKPAALPDVQVLVDALPDGLDVVEGRVRVSEGAGYALLGRVKWTHSTGLLSKTVIVTELRYLAQAAGANLVLMSFTRETTADASGAVALILRTDKPLDPAKRKVGKVPTEI